MKKPIAYFSHSPWLGFTKADKPRKQPLPRCPDPRCRRAKQCVAAHDDLYCQRTHMTIAEASRITPHAGLTEEERRIQAPVDPRNLEARRIRIVEALELGIERAREKQARWKSGEFDHLYGKYSPKGVLMKPPVRSYVEHGHGARTNAGHS
jgi:hypothetical protein